MEMEKTSYTLKHNGEEHDDSKNESYEPLDEEIAIETDKMLSKDKTDAIKSIEVLADADENTALDEKTEALKATENSTVPTKNRFLQFFDRKKPKTEQTVGQNGKTETSPVDGMAPELAPKKRFIPIKLQNPFAKKTETDVPATNTNGNNKPTNEASSSDEKKADEVEEKKTETKFKPLASIKVPNFSGLLNKLRRTGRSDDIELGSGPKGKAGLASMETLDDSTKDPWNQENEPDGVEKPEEAKKAEAAAPAVTEEEKKPTLIESIRGYDCSIDDFALIAGIVVFFLLVALILAFTFLGSPKQTQIAPIRDGKVLAVTSCGLVEGLVEDSAVAFRGIPYAKPPVNDFRFEHAEVIDDIKFCWNGTFKAHNCSTECLQVTNGKTTGQEDCLVLDIVTPEVRYINLLPVVVMIGANDYLGGSPGILRPSARYARSKDIVFVRPRFRLNVFGFLALEALSNSSNVPASGNYALSDIIAALEWIQTNIKHFGGDPSSVTLFGHRTGATLVTALTSSSKASKLFARVWVSSPSAHFPGKPLSENERENSDYARAFPGCDDKTCWQKEEDLNLLDKVPPSWIKDFSTTLPSIDENKSKRHDFLVLDGDILKKHPQDVWKLDPKFASKIVIGTTAHVAFDKTKQNIFSNLTTADVRRYVSESKIGQANLTNEAIELYGDSVQGLIAMISDIRYVCPLLVLARSSEQNLPFYIVSQTQGDLKLADVDSDVQAILGRYDSESPEKRRYLDAIRQLFYYYVAHGKVLGYRAQNFVLKIEQDVLPDSDIANCDFWIKNAFVPHYATVF